MDADIVALWEAAKKSGVKKRDLAKSLGMTYRQFEGRLYRAKRKRVESNEKVFDVVDIGRPLWLRGDWIIVGDVHVPFTDYDFAQLPAMIAKKHLKKPRKLLIAGDLFDMSTFSRYESVVQAPTWAQEREAARQLMREWHAVFDRVVVLMGNHDRRLQKWLGGAFDETDLGALIGIRPDRTEYSNWGWCVIETEMGEWRVTHPRNYSINQLTVGDALAQKFHQHIISHHEHHVAIGWDRYKRYVVVNNGCLADPEKLAYAILDDSKSAGMQQGFVMLRNGVPYLFSNEPFTDWERWL